MDQSRGTQDGMDVGAGDILQYAIVAIFHSGAKNPPLALICSLPGLLVLLLMNPIVIPDRHSKL